MISLEEAEGAINRKVVYRPGHTTSDVGYIKSVNMSYVFVVYEGDYYAKATVPEDLEFLTKA